MGKFRFITNKQCPFCGNVPVYFKDELSYKEWEISGLCQDCQDDFFTENEEE